METIKEILGKVVGKLEQKRHIQDDIETMWQQAAQKRLSKHTKVQQLKGSTLYIKAENPAWLYAVRIKQGRIEKTLNRLSHKKIKSIRIRVGDMHGE